MEPETIEQTFLVADTPRLRISNVRGTVSIKAGTPGSIYVKAVKHTSSGDAKRTIIELTQEADGSVRAETRYQEGGWAWFRFSNPCKVDYTVTVPQGIVLKASGVTSTLTVDGLQGEFDLNSVNGEVELWNLTGGLKATTVSGELYGDHLAGTFSFETVSGDVRICESDLPQVHGTTVSGDIILQSALKEGPYYFNSVSGNINVLVPADTRATASLKSVSGSLQSSLPTTGVQYSRGTQVVQLQGGGVPLQMSSVSGTLWIGTPEDQERESRQTAAPTPAPLPLSNSEILKKVERGELSVEEAVKLMQE